MHIHEQTYTHTRTHTQSYIQIHAQTHSHFITCSVSRVRYIKWLVGVASSDLEVQRHRHLLFPRMLRDKGKPNTPPYGEGGGVYLQWQREGREEKREGRRGGGEGGWEGGGEGRENDTM